MNARLVVPASVAMALHAILFFGFSSDSWPGARLVRDVIKASPAPDKPVLIEFSSPTDPAAHSLAMGVPDEARPDLPDPPVNDQRAIFTMPPAPPHPPATRIATTLDVGPIGVPEGSETVGPSDFTSVQLDNPPRTRSQVSPTYPYEARINGRSGEVMVEFVVDETGRVLDPHVLRSSDTIFEAPTLRAVSKWRFEPGRKGGRIVRFRMTVPVGFSVTS